MGIHPTDPNRHNEAHPNSPSYGGKRQGPVVRNVQDAVNNLMNSTSEHPETGTTLEGQLITLRRMRRNYSSQNLQKEQEQMAQMIGDLQEKIAAKDTGNK